MTFIIWIVAMLIAVGLLVIVGHRGKTQASKTEQVAQEALPTIGGIAERQHTMRFGRPPSNVPVRAGVKDSWYPPTKKKAAATKV